MSRKRYAVEEIIRKLLADSMLDNAILKEVSSGNY